MAARRYEIFSSSVEKYSTSEHSERVKYFQHEKTDFVSPCNVLFIISTPVEMPNHFTSRKLTWYFTGVYLSNRPHFKWVYRRDSPRGMLGEHEKSLMNFSSVLSTSQVGYHAGKPIESALCCFYKITLKHVSVFYEFTAAINHRLLTNQDARTILVIL